MCVRERGEERDCVCVSERERWESVSVRERVSVCLFDKTKSALS